MYRISYANQFLTSRNYQDWFEINPEVDSAYKPCLSKMATSNHITKQAVVGVCDIMLSAAFHAKH
jgi:hypothetical protein